MITLDELKSMGFKDVSLEKNGLAYRIRLNNLLEVCFYIAEGRLRLQTVESGFSQFLPGIRSKEDLKQFFVFLTWHG